MSFNEFHYIKSFLKIRNIVLFVKYYSKSLIKLEQCKLNNNGEFIKVHLTLVSSPQCFVIQLYDNLGNVNFNFGLLMNKVKWGIIQDLFDFSCFEWYPKSFFDILLKTCLINVLSLVPLNEMMAELQLFCQRKKDVVPLETIVKGEVYAALNEDDDKWYR